MTVSTSDNREEYVGNDSTTVFGYAFKIFAATDLEVYLVENGAQTLQTLNTDYTVSDVGEESGGNVTMTTAPTSSQELVILRVIAVTQETDLRNQGAYYPETLEDEFDRGRMIDQQQQDELNRSLKKPEGGDHFDAGSARIENLADAVSIGDAVNLDVLQKKISGIESGEVGDATLVTATGTTDERALSDWTKALGYPSTATGEQTLAEALDQRGPVFDTVAAMSAAAGLTIGVKCRTLGYYAVGDGGGNDYEIVAAGSGTADGGSFINLSGSGHQAKGLFLSGLSIKQFGAVGDGTTDDTSAVVNTVAYAAANEVRVIKAPAVAKGSFYLLSNEIVITKGVTIKGDGWESYDNYTAPNYERGAGSWFKVTNTAEAGFAIRRPTSGRCTGVRFEDIALFWDQPAPGAGWAPTATEYAFRFESVDDCNLSNVMILNPEKGVLVTGSTAAPAGRIDIDGLFGQPLRVGVNCDFSADVCRWDNLHLWPYWSDDSNVLDWQRANATYSTFGRNDNMQGTNWFGFAYGVGLFFGDSAEGFVTSRLKLSNIEFDSTRRAVHVSAAAAASTAQISNFAAVAPPTLTTADQFISEASGVVFDWVNFRITNSRDSGVRVSGSNALHRFSQPWIEDWDLSTGGNAAFFADSGSTIKVTDPKFTDGGGSPKSGGSGDVFINSRDEVFTGSLNAEGKAVIAHGVGSLDDSVTNIAGWFLNGALWEPLNLLYFDNTNAELQSPNAGTDSGDAYRVIITHT